MPLHLLNTLRETPFEWLVPGLLREKVTWSLKALPKNIRKQLFPLTEQVDAFLASPPVHDPGVGAKESFFEALCKFVQRRIGEPVPESAWRDRELPAHLRMNIRVVDESGRELAIDAISRRSRRSWAGRTITFGQANRA